MNEKKPTLLIRVDADADSGIGHVMRCIALAQAWQRASGSVIFLSRSLSPVLQKRIAAKGFELIQSSENASGTDEKKILVKSLEKICPDWVVLDGYHFAPEHQILIRRFGSRLLVIDDHHHLESYHADILLNQNLGAEKISYQCPEACTQLLGLPYVMLRNEFLDLPKRSLEPPRKGNHVLVTLGGSDPSNATLNVIEALRLLADKSLQINLLIGPANRHRAALENAAASASFNCRVLHSANNMPELMQETDLAVSAGGSTVWELAFLGVPAIYIILADNQRAIVREVSRAGAGINAGWHEDIRPEQLSKTIQALILDKNRRKQMAGKGSGLVSGKGADLVVSKMIGMLVGTQK